MGDIAAITYTSAKVSVVVGDGVGDVYRLFGCAGHNIYDAERRAVVVQAREASIVGSTCKEDVAVMLADEPELTQAVAGDVAIERHAVKSSNTNNSRIAVTWHVDYAEGEGIDAVEVEYLAVALANEEVLSILDTVVHHAAYTVLHTLAEA